MTLDGKGYFIWKISHCEGGYVARIARMAAEADFTHVLVKIANGAYKYNIDPKTGEDMVGPLVDALRAKDIQVWGWHYVYGYDPIGEAEIAIKRTHEFQLDGYVIDAEAEYKLPGKEKAAETFMARLRHGLRNVPVALSSYRFPSFHPQLPWDEFLEKCDLSMPQVYWVKNHNPAAQLRRTLSEYQSLNYVRPVIPTGSAYKQGGWEATVEDVNEFMDATRKLNLGAANFWEWVHTRKFLPEVWDAITEYDWTPDDDQEEDFAQVYIDLLNTHDQDKVIELYHDYAVHVTSTRTIQGTQALREWYKELFTRILPNAIFSISSRIGKGKMRHITWTATSSAGSVRIGSDTFSLEDGLIAYHYTFFIII